MNKYMILAIVPILFQSALYSADLNTILKSELQNAQQIMKSSTKTELDHILRALVLYGKQSEAYCVKAINVIKDIKNALLQYRSEQYTDNWMQFCKFFNVHPEKVSKDIDPALIKVNNALKQLQKNASILGYVKAATLAAFVCFIALPAVGEITRIGIAKYSLYENDLYRIKKMNKILDMDGITNDAKADQLAKFAVGIYLSPGSDFFNRLYIYIKKIALYTLENDKKYRNHLSSTLLLALNNVVDFRIFTTHITLNGQMVRFEA